MEWELFRPEVTLESVAFSSYLWLSEWIHPSPHCLQEEPYQGGGASSEVWSFHWEQNWGGSNSGDFIILSQGMLLLPLYIKQQRFSFLLVSGLFDEQTFVTYSYFITGFKSSIINCMHKWQFFFVLCFGNVCKCSLIMIHSFWYLCSFLTFFIMLLSVIHLLLLFV